jgi:hypothetical protein
MMITRRPENTRLPTFKELGIDAHDPIASEHLAHLLAAAKEADEGRVIDVTDMSVEEFLRTMFGPDINPQDAS